MLIQKTTKSERLMNGATLDQLMFSFFDTNILGFKRVLSENGTFLGRNKMEFLSRLNTRFNELKERKVFGVGAYKGICIDIMPGCEVIEVRYAMSPDLLDENGMYFNEANSPAKPGEEVFRFAFQLKEGKVREWAQEYDSLIVYCGGVFDSIDAYIGSNRVAVPHSYYKAIYAPATNQAIAFVLPNQRKENPLRYYLRSIDSLEELIEVDFYSEIDSAEQVKFESKVSSDQWF